MVSNFGWLLTFWLYGAESLFFGHPHISLAELRIKPSASLGISVEFITVGARTRSKAFGNEAILLVLTDETE